MKRTFTINISGIVFHIDDDAYETLQDYLGALQRSFENKEEGKEILVDIEARIAELFQERLTGSREVISITDVQEIIAILGAPEDFHESEEPQSETHNDYSYSGKEKWRTGKRMYRDLDESILGGVASGLGAYFGIDTMIMRILFIISFFFMGPLLYIVLWIVIPAARTSAQKIEMRGERVNIENLERQVRNEYENVKSNFRNFKKKDHAGKLEDFISEFVHIFTIIAKPLSRVLIFIAAIFVFVFIISILVKVLGHFWMGDFFFTDFFNNIQGLPFPAFLGLIINHDYINLVMIGVIIIVLVPVIAILTGIIKGLMGWKGFAVIGGLLSAVLIIGLSLVSYVAIVESTNFKGHGKVIDSYSFAVPESKILTVSIPNGPYEECLDEDDYDFEDECGYYYDWKNYKIVDEHFKIVAEEGTMELSIAPEIVIKKADTDSIKVKIKKSSLGKDMEEAKMNAQTLQYSWSVEGDKLNLDPYFTLKKEEKWRNQDVEMIITIPENMEIQLHDNANLIVKEYY